MSLPPDQADFLVVRAQLPWQTSFGAGPCAFWDAPVCGAPCAHWPPISTRGAGYPAMMPLTPSSGRVAFEISSRCCYQCRHARTLRDSGQLKHECATTVPTLAASGES